MSVTAYVDTSYTVVPRTTNVDREAVTLHGLGATAVVANWGVSSDTATSDTVNLSANLTGVVARTSTASLTSSLAQLLQGASHVDQATGEREINQGIGDTLASQIGQILVGSGFSQADATKASASLVQQFASASSGTNVVALSLSSQGQNVGSYTAVVAGGKEASAYSVKSTVTLNLAFNVGTGDLSVKLDQHKVAATRIEWSSATASNVSIELTQPELEAVGLTPVGTNSNDTGSPVQETRTTTADYDRDSGVGSSNVPGQNALGWYLNFENAAKPATAQANTNSTRSSINKAGSSPIIASISSTTQSPAEEALIALKKLVADARSAFVEERASGRYSVNLSINQQIGAAVTGQDGNKSLLYTRPSGDTATVGIPSVSINA